MPLQCDSPILQSWLARLQWGCSILGVPCDTYISPELGVCPSKWSPLAMMGTTAVFLALSLLFTTVVFRNFFRCLLLLKPLYTKTHRHSNSSRPVRSKPTQEDACVKVG